MTLVQMYPQKTAWHAETTDGWAKPQQQITNNENNLRWRGRGQSSVMRSEMQSLVFFNSKFCSRLHSTLPHSLNSQIHSQHYSFWVPRWEKLHYYQVFIVIYITQKNEINPLISKVLCASHLLKLSYVSLYNIHWHNISHQPLRSLVIGIRSIEQPILVIYLTALSKATYRNGQQPKCSELQGNNGSSWIAHVADLQPFCYQPLHHTTP